MHNRTFLAYSVAGVAAALAITAISASAFAGGNSPPSDGTSAVAAPAAQGTVVDGIEYVYVDAPAGSDDEWEDEEHEDDEDHEREEHEERGGLLSWLRGGEHDDDDDDDDDD